MRPQGCLKQNERNTSTTSSRKLPNLLGQSLPEVLSYPYARRGNSRNQKSDTTNQRVQLQRFREIDEPQAEQLRRSRLDEND